MTLFNHNRFLSTHYIYNEFSQKYFWEKYHFSKNPKNTELNFFVEDTEEKFNNNLKKENTYKILEKCGWVNKSITYKFNNYGFRSNNNYDIKDLCNIPMFIGGSIVEAIGVNIEDSFAYKISKKLNSPIFYNIAQSGTGSENTYRLFKAWGNLTKPSAVYWVPTPEPRREFIVDEHDIKTLASWSTGKELDILGYYMSYTDEISIHTVRLFDSIKNVARELGAELYIPSKETIMYADSCGSGFIARDFMHPSVQWHDALAEKMNEWQKVV